MSTPHFKVINKRVEVLMLSIVLFVVLMRLLDTSVSPILSEKMESHCILPATIVESNQSICTDYDESTAVTMYETYLSINKGLYHFVFAPAYLLHGLMHKVPDFILIIILIGTHILYWYLLSWILVWVWNHRYLPKDI